NAKQLAFLLLIRWLQEAYIKVGSELCEEFSHLPGRMDHTVPHPRPRHILRTGIVEIDFQELFISKMMTGVSCGIFDTVIFDCSSAMLAHRIVVNALERINEEVSILKKQLELLKMPSKETLINSNSIKRLAHQIIPKPCWHIEYILKVLVESSP
ncbi:MAG: hypothetical protein RR505_09525, partial [Raoultibacter sp.]